MHLVLFVARETVAVMSYLYKC